MTNKHCAPSPTNRGYHRVAVALTTIACLACQPTMARKMKPSEFFDDPKVVSLVDAAARGDLDGVRQAIALGADANRVGREGITPLLFVLSDTHNRDGMRALLRVGADPNYMAPNGGCAMVLAAGAKDKEILSLMLDGGGNPNIRTSDGEPLTFAAIWQHRWDNLYLLIGRGAEIDARDSTGDAAINLLADLGYWDQVAKLVIQGADFRSSAANGSTVSWSVYETKYKVGNPNYDALMRVKQMLIDRGVHFPPPSPEENRRRMGVRRAD